ncbi:MAG TPA: sugar ABC transporter permease [Streptosporangiaceae bacterium]
MTTVGRRLAARTPPAADAALRAAARRARRRGALRVLAFLAPGIVGFAVFFAYPLAATVYFSFTRYNMFTLSYAGLDNYRFLLHDGDALQAIRNTLWLVVVMVPLQVVFALGVAQLLTRIKAGAGIFRTVFYLPYLVPPVAATVATVFLLNPATGPVNTIAARLGVRLPDWFNDPGWAKPALTLMSMWAIGNIMVIFLAALLDVPAELYEAAAIDGAGPLQRFRHVTLPTISPVLLFAAVTGVIETLQYFTQAQVASKVASGQTDLPGSNLPPGYPDGSTLTFPQWLYQQGFQEFNMGYACVLAIVLFVVAMAFTAILLRRFHAFAEDA